MKLGLIRARNYAAKLATGRVLIFLDSHIEVNVGWLQPLLHHLSIRPKSVALPLVDVIDEKTFEYSATPHVVGGFTWNLRFAWDPLPASVPLDEPFHSPVMSGGLLAVRASTFHAFGAYDNLMETWGGENLEMSFRYWQCGAPCTPVPALGWPRVQEPPTVRRVLWPGQLAVQFCSVGQRVAGPVSRGVLLSGAQGCWCGPWRLDLPAGAAADSGLRVF
ncbi:hypothetical protein BOX15_Mlig028237g1 [Macrostomum lignano]|uniref:Glycosyltransferase 2-like domain-containing protein n=1 Tax=Macrostomum lignano TaxID=282301 RepID=A0A267DDT5_9PLAT|nr:hypothetical protein BOX15_Mlig028237g1 [Macrostomum lignano]